MITQTFVDTLYDSYKNQKALKKEVFPSDINLDEAYQVQHAFTEAKRENNECLKGYKISMTSPETQALFEAKEPLYGQMTDKQITG
ncbi:fumarylacetoacetate hydrolase, partial [Bacillus sp. V59.32b]